MSELLVAGPGFDIAASVLNENGSPILGESQRAGFEDSIVLGGVQAYVQSMDGNCEPEIPVFNRFVLSKVTDRATPALLEKAASGAVLQSVVIEQIEDTGGGLYVPYEWTLANVVIEDVEIASGASQIERWTLSFDRVQLMYRSLNGDGSVNESTTPFCWDLAANAVCAP